MIKCNRLILLCTHLLLSSHKELAKLTKHGVPNQLLAMVTDRDLENFISTDKDNEKLYYIAQQILQFLAIQKLIDWEIQVSKLTYTGREYFRLHPIEKLCCISNDFFHFTKGTWSTLDLLQMKSLLFNCGFPMRTHFSLNEFIEYIVAHPSLIKKLFNEINIELLMKFPPCELPSLKAIEKILKLQDEEYHIVEHYKKQKLFLMLNEQS